MYVSINYMVFAVDLNMFSGSSEDHIVVYLIKNVSVDVLLKITHMWNVHTLPALTVAIYTCHGDVNFERRPSDSLCCHCRVMCNLGLDMIC